MSTEHILTELSERVLTIRLNRLDKKNALTQAMYSAMAAALDSARDDAQVRVAVFAGTADCFCAGNDLMDFLNLPPTDMNNPVMRFMVALSTFPKPVIAAPAGIAVGIGVTLLLHSDLVYCGTQTKLNMPFVNLGICPEFASSYLLPRLMGHARACELVLLGEPFTAQKALEYGLVNALLPNADVETAARAKAVAIAQLPPNAVRTTKAILKRWTADTVQQAIPLEANHFGPMLKQPEALEAITSFMQKRKPDFSKFA